MFRFSKKTKVTNIYDFIFRYIRGFPCPKFIGNEIKQNKQIKLIAMDAVQYNF